jgi:acyl-CoA hydrolase
MVMQRAYRSKENSNFLPCRLLIFRTGKSFEKGMFVETYCLVRPEHLNHHGYLFGGQLLKWVDEFAWLAAAREYPGYTLVTRAMADIQFSKRVSNGAILRFDITLYKQGNSSVSYTVAIFASNQSSKSEEMVFSTRVTFVALDDKGEKVRLPGRD